MAPAPDLQMADPAGGARPAESNADEETGALRRCVATGLRHPPEAMIRFVVGPDGTIVPDLDARLPGRGLWLCAGRAMLETACAKALFARAARATVRVPADLPETVERLLRARCLDLIGLARRAGVLTWGFERVRLWLQNGRAGLIVAARDGAAGGLAKVRALSAQRPVIGVFSAAELGQALGQETVVHAALEPGRLAERLQAATARLEAYVKNGAPAGRGTDECNDRNA
jgi:predicted RNA-binding protein YlxR (DUF448 family)